MTQTESTILAQNEVIRRKDAEIKRLKKALRTLLNSDDDEVAETGSTKDGDNSDTLSVDEEEDSDSNGLPEALLLENTYHCVECGWEVIKGVCSQCGLEHEWTFEHEREDRKNNAPYNGDNLAIHWDRSLAPRGITPLIHGPFFLQVQDLGDEDISARQLSLSQDRDDYLEYLPLLVRGATIDMCERYQLEFTHEGGIYAWADEDLMDEFSGAAMKPGDQWKIHLGRQITLEDTDLDGCEFIEDLLEDAVLFPLRSDHHPRKYERWQTTEETPGIWVTHLMEDRKQEADDSDLESDASDHDVAWEAMTVHENAAIEPDAPTVPEGPIRPDNYIEAEYEGEEFAGAIDADENDNNDVDYRLRDDLDTAWDSDTEDSYWDAESSSSESGDEELPTMDVEYLEDLGRRIRDLTVAQREREAVLEESD